MAGGAERARDGPRVRARGTPRQGGTASQQEWHSQAQFQVDADGFARELRRGAALLVATDVLDENALPDLEVL